MSTNIKLDQQNATGLNKEGNDANSPVTILTATSIIGDKIENKQGQIIGEVKDIMLNMIDGKIQYLVIEFGGFLGFGEKLFAVPFSAMKLNPHKKDFTLDIEKEFLRTAPGFDKDHWPETNGHYTHVNTHWGDFMGANTGGGF